MPTDLKKAIYDSLTMGKEGIKSAFMPNRLGGPDAESALKAALMGGLGATSVPVSAMDEAALGVGNVIAEDTGRAAAAVERAGYPSMAKGLAGGGIALGMAPFIGGMAIDPEMGAAKAAGASVLERLAASNLPEAVLRKAESLQALHGEKALADLVQEYADRGVPLFSHDLPMDEASRMARASELNTLSRPMLHGGKGGKIKFDTTRAGENLYSDWGPGVYSTPNPNSADYYATVAAKSNDPILKRIGEEMDIEGAKTISINGAPQYSEKYDNLLAQLRARSNELENNPSGATVTPLMLQNSPYLHYMGGGVTDTNLSKYAAEKGSPHAFVMEGPEGGKYLTEAVTNDPTKLRSPYAAFDPRMKDSKFLLALKAGAIPLAGISAFSQGEK